MTSVYYRPALQTRLPVVHPAARPPRPNVADLRFDTSPLHALSCAFSLPSFSSELSCPGLV